MNGIARQLGRCFLAIGLVFTQAKLAFSQGPSKLLKEILTAQGVPFSNSQLTNLDKKIKGGPQLNDSNQFTIAYYLDDGTGYLNLPLFIDRYDKKKKKWHSAALPDPQDKTVEPDGVCFGSIPNIGTSQGWLFLSIHINPSAECLLVLSPDLKLEASLYGWLLAQLGPDLLLYHCSEVHFAPVHPAEIAIYDLRSKRDEAIFPPKIRTPIREARIAQLREFYKLNSGWCQKNDDPCDPESFDSDISGQVATSEAESAAAFLVSYQQIQLVQGDVQKPSGPKEVLYVYRRLDDPRKMEFREMLWGDAKSQFGNISLQSLLQPEALARIFSEPSKKP